MPTFCITGVAGTGKSTVIAELQKKKIAAIDLDLVPGLCSWINKRTGKKTNYNIENVQKFLDEHNYDCDLEKLKKIIEKHQGQIFVVGGITSNKDKIFADSNKVILLHCNKDIFLKRLQTRTNSNFGKTRKEQKHLLTWYKDFEKRLIGQGAIPINTSRPLQKVIDDIMKIIRIK